MYIHKYIHTYIHTACIYRCRDVHYSLIKTFITYKMGNPWMLIVPIRFSVPQTQEQLASFLLQAQGLPYKHPLLLRGQQTTALTGSPWPPFLVHLTVHLCKQKHFYHVKCPKFTFISIYSSSVQEGVECQNYTRYHEGSALSGQGTV